MADVLMAALSAGAVPAPTIVVAARAVAVAALAWAIVVAYRRIRRSSHMAAAVFVAGVVIRAVAGGALFAISYLHLPVFSSLQMGDGFWTLAIDARSYFNEAAAAVENGIGTISGTTASPTYVRVLATWMAVFGVSPITAVLLNVVCYVVVALLIVEASRASRKAGILTLTAVTASPALLIFGTQPLKDSLCVLLIATALYGVQLWSKGFGRDRAQWQLYSACGGALLLASIFAMSGIRAYVGLFMIIASVASAVALFVMPGASRSRMVVPHLLMTPLLWLAFSTGAGQYYPYYASIVRAAVSAPLRPVIELDNARSAFVATGGGTSIEARPHGLLGKSAPASTGELDQTSRAIVQAGDNQAVAMQVLTPPREAGAVSPSAVAADRPRLVAAVAHATLLRLDPPLSDTVQDGPAPTHNPEAAVGLEHERLLIAGGDSTMGRVVRLLRGCAVVFVPISLLRSLSIVDFSGGRGLLFVTDVDTLLIDGTLAIALYLLFSRRRRSVLPVTVFVLVFATLTTLTLAYVVTNFGTLFRLRLLAVAPLWLLPAFVERSRTLTRRRIGVSANCDGPVMPARR